MDQDEPYGDVVKQNREEEAADVPNDKRKYPTICDEINKRVIGNVIVQYCGNEGSKDDSNKATLRRLLQAVISYLENERPETWLNAEVIIYDDNFDDYSIRAGIGQNLFLATFDGLGNPQVVKTSKEKIESFRGHSKQSAVKE